MSYNAVDKQCRIAVLCGGLSSERDVSLRSGNNCLAALHRLGYANAVLIDMTRDVARQLTDARIELVYLALHGTYGEDGCIQGMLEILDIPYSGNGVMASALTMDKAITKQILRDAGLPVLASLVLTEPTVSPEAVNSIGFPLMVKPLNEGSSVGMSKVDTPEDLPAALQLAFETAAKGTNPKVLLEPFLSGASLTVGVLDRPGQETFATPILELRTKTGWYDYESKYTAGLTEFILPAELDAKTTQTIQQLSIEAHKACDCFGVSRIDWMANPGGQLAILEINTIPGMTDLSDLPAQAKAMGIEYDQLVDILLHSAVNGPRSGKKMIEECQAHV